MTVLFISYDGISDNLGQSQVLSYLLKLSAHHEIIILSTEKKNNYAKRSQLIEKQIEGKNILWKYIFYSNKTPIISARKNKLKLLKKATEICDKYSVNLIHCRSVLPASIGIKLKNKYNIPFIFDMRGFWADERVDGKVWNRKKPIYDLIYKHFKKIERKALIEAKHIVSLTENGKNEILNWKLPVDRNKITVIPCCTDLNLFRINSEWDKSRMKKELNLSETHKHLIYVGSVGTWYMLDEMLEFYKTLKSEDSSYKFLFLTAEPKEMIISKAESKGINKDDLIITLSERVNVPKYIYCSDLSVFFILPAYSKKASCPTKMGEIMAMGTPLICNTNVGDVDEICINYSAGSIVSKFDFDSYKNALSSLNKNYSKDKSIEGAKTYFSLENGAKKYLDIYNNI